MTPLRRFARDWSALWQARPGRRFQELYRRRHDRRASELRRLALAAAGVLLVLLGALLVLTPGPGGLVLVAGALLLAMQSRRAARLFDRSEVRMRGLMREIGRR